MNTSTPRGPRRTWFSMWCAVALSGVGGGLGCVDTGDRIGESPEPTGTTGPAPETVDAVLFLIGDAGSAEEGKSPLITHMRSDVEAWSAALPDSSVLVLFLGDNVYEVGIREPDDPGYATDTLRLNTQIRVVTGPDARSARTRAIFLAGNHDWGNETGNVGLARVGNMAAHIDGIADPDTAQIFFMPEPGSLGPAAVDLGQHARILTLDGQLLLQDPDEAGARALLNQIEAELSGTDGRHIVISSHLPLLTGGPHGGAIPFFPTLGFHYLAYKSGMLVQDVTSRPYRTMIEGFLEVFARAGPPLVLAGGHDHSLQVLVDTIADGREYIQLVSGSGSRTTRIRATHSMKWGRSSPGYMRLTFLRDGSVQLDVVVGSVTHLACLGPDAGSAASCMAAGADSIHTGYSRRLR